MTLPIIKRFGTVTIYSNKKELGNTCETVDFLNSVDKYNFAIIFMKL